MQVQHIAEYPSETEGRMQADHESCELLRAIARPTDAGQIRRLAAEVHDWDSLLKLAQEHRVSLLLFSRLADMGSAVPLTVQEHLRAEYEVNIFYSLANTVELLAVLKAFERENISALPFKGVVLGASAYQDPTTRPAGDLDLLIHASHLARATAILLERGYELKAEVKADGTPAHSDECEYPFERDADGMVFELRWKFELTRSQFKRNLGMDWVGSRRRTTMLAGAEVPDMTPEITLLVLCMHGSGSKHVWSRLIWIYDVAQLLASSPKLDWDGVIHEARKSGLYRALALGVLLAQRVSGAIVPQEVLQRFEADKTACSLAQHVQQNLFHAPGSKPISRMPYGIRLLSLRDRIRLLFSLHLLRPNARDRAAVPLPKSLHALHYLTRPFRILWDRSSR